MIKTKEIIIESDSYFQNLKNEINNIQKGYLTDDYKNYYGTISEIKNSLWKENQKLKVMIEFPYYDKEYLNEYSNYYCKKFNIPSNKTFRLIFYTFINSDEYELMGYIILVPTPSLNHIGRISFNPKFLVNSANLMLTDCKIHFDGKKEVFKMFPHARQYGLTACGHVSIWAVSKFVGSSWDRYSDKEFEQIVDTVNLINPKTKISPPELTVTQIAGVLADFGYRPLFKPFTEDNQNEFLSELYSYIDSGIPLVLLDGKYNHALVGLGYQRGYSYQFESSPIKSLASYEQNSFDKVDCESNCVVVNSSQEMKIYTDKIFYNSVIINDDNSFPYRKITLYKNNLNASDGIRTDLSLLNLFGFIVPLYPRINIEYPDVKDFSNILIKEKGLDLGFIKPKQQTVFVRIFLASANKCREHIYEQAQDNIFARAIYDILKTVELSKLCWVIEYSTFDEQKEDLISGFSLIDSTCAFNDNNLTLFNCGFNNVEYYDDEAKEHFIIPVNISNTQSLNLRKYNKNLTVI